MVAKSTWSVGQLAQEALNEPSERSLAWEVLVEQSGTTCNRYQYKREHRALRLGRGLLVEASRPASIVRSSLESLRSDLVGIVDSIRHDHTTSTECRDTWLPLPPIGNA